MEIRGYIIYIYKCKLLAKQCLKCDIAVHSCVEYNNAVLCTKEIEHKHCAKKHSLFSLK